MDSWLSELLSNLQMWKVALIFLGCAVIIAFAGYHLTRAADQLADLTGLGEALTGAVLLGGITSISGIATSVTAGYAGHPELAVSNAIGGIAAQTAFLAMADLAHPKINLEHAAASLANITQGVLLTLLIAIVMVTVLMPEFSFFGVHPASIALIIIYGFGIRSTRHVKDMPMWRPIKTLETVVDKPDPETEKSTSLAAVATRFSLTAIIVAVAGYVVAQSGITISESSDLSESVVGSMFTAVVTSLPELFVAVAAVRQGALTLAVSNIIGGNCFDVLFVAFSDLAYSQGSIYHDAGDRPLFIMALALILNAILILGLIIREKRGPGSIGWEGFFVLLAFLAGQWILFGM